MNRSFTLMEVIAVIVVIGILAALVIPNISRSSIVARESAAQSNLMVISAAQESYATANNGSYATAESQLTSPTPPYLNRSFCSQTVEGYSYSCTFGSTTSYSVTASPSSCGTTGNTNYTVSTGGALSSAGCGG